MTLLQQVKDAARGRWDTDILPAFGFNPECLTGQHGPCPMPGCGGTDRFRAFDDVAETGGVFCNQCHNSRNSDGIAAIQRMHNWTFPQTVEAIASHLGIGTGSHQPVNRPITRPTPAAKPEAKPAAPATLYATVQDAVDVMASRLGQPVATFDYLDETGSHYSRVCRFEPKTFRPVSLFPGGWGLAGPQYRLPYRANLIHSAKIVFVVEGEGVADSLAAIGLDAVTSMNGARSEQKTDWTPLAGKTVVILPDNDEPGREYARNVAKILRGLGCIVKIIELPGLPEKGDFIDWRETFGDAAEPADIVAALNQLVDAAPIDGGKRAESAKNGAERTQTPSNKLKNEGLRYASALVFKSFPFEILPKSLSEFCIQQAKTICCDPTLILLPALATAAGLIGNSRRAVVRRTWSEPAILWTCAVADSGSGKSPAFDAATAPLKKLQRIACQEYDRAMAEYKSLKSQFDQQQKGRKGIESIAEPVLPQLQDIFLEDTTIEAIAPALLARPRGSMLACEELSGWYGRHNAYKTTSGGDEAFYLQAHGARPAKINRRSGGKIFIPQATLSITGTIQGPILKKVLSSSHRESGLAARFLFSSPPEQIRQWSDDEVPHDVIQSYNTMMLRLADLQMAQGEFDDPEPVYIGMTAQAQRRFREFYDEIGSTRPDLDSSEMKAAWSKLEGGAVRLALVFSCCRYVLGEKAREVIDDQDMEAGIVASRWFAHEAERIYSMLVESDQDSELRDLVSWIQSQGGEVLPTDLRQKKRRYRESGSAEAVLQTLVNQGLGEWSDTSTTPVGGRPARRFILSNSGRVPETPLFQAVEGGLRPRDCDFDDFAPATWAAQDEVSESDIAEFNQLFGESA